MPSLHRGSLVQAPCHACKGPALCRLRAMHALCRLHAVRANGQPCAGSVPCVHSTGLVQAPSHACKGPALHTLRALHAQGLCLVQGLRLMPGSGKHWPRCLLQARISTRVLSSLLPSSAPCSPSPSLHPAPSSCPPCLFAFCIPCCPSSCSLSPAPSLSFPLCPLSVPPASLPFL